MKQLVEFAFECGDPVKCINSESKFFNQVGNISHARVYAKKRQKPQIDYVVLFNAKPGGFGNQSGTFSSASLERMTGDKV